MDICHLNVAPPSRGATFDVSDISDVEFGLSFGNYEKRCSVPTPLILMAISVVNPCANSESNSIMQLVRLLTKYGEEHSCCANCHLHYTNFTNGLCVTLTLSSILGTPGIIVVQRCANTDTRHDDSQLLKASSYDTTFTLMYLLWLKNFSSC